MYSRKSMKRKELRRRKRSGTRATEGAVDLHSDSDDDFYIRAVHTTFSNSSCGGVDDGNASRTTIKPRATRRTPSGFLTEEAPCMRVKNHLFRLGKFTKDVLVPTVKMAFVDKMAAKLEEKSSGERLERYSRIIKETVGKFFKGENGDADGKDNRPAVGLSEVQSVTSARARLGRRRDDARPAVRSRKTEDLSTEDSSDYSDASGIPASPAMAMKNRRRSLSSTVIRWQRCPEALLPPIYEEQFYDVPEFKPVYERRQHQEAVAYYSSFFGRLEHIQHLFLVLTVVLLAAVVYRFELLSVLIFLCEMFVPHAMLTGALGAMTFIGIVLTFDAIKKLTTRC